MNKEFNKEILFDNISFLIKKLGKKIGEVETEVGVSPGYISRTSKDGGAKPGIDFIVKICGILNVSIDTLISTDLSSLTPTEQYLISFFEKLKSDTLNDDINWNVETAENLSITTDVCGNSLDNPLLEYREFYDDVDRLYGSCQVVFHSATCGDDAIINGDCYNLRLKNGVMLYIMNASKRAEQSVCAKEIWMFAPSSSVQFLCSTISNFALSDLIEDLYSTIQESMKHPKINNTLKNAIDAYMNNDITDDFIDDLPF